MKVFEGSNDGRRSAGQMTSALYCRSNCYAAVTRRSSQRLERLFGYPRGLTAYDLNAVLIAEAVSGARFRSNFN